MKSMLIGLASAIAIFSSSTTIAFATELTLNVPFKSVTKRLEDSDDKNVQLPVPGKTQNTQVWCWAATTASVVEFINGTPVADFQLLSNYFSFYAGRRVDCTREQLCLRPGQDFEIAALYNMNQITAAQVYKAPTFEEIVGWMDRTHMPMIAKLSNPESQIGHVIIIAGYNSENRALLVIDPLADRARWFPFDWVAMNFYGKGLRWVESFLPYKVTKY